jgi:sugar O-acyltransferase (sialic acid O-acetyltransferase NeuD family)
MIEVRNTLSKPFCIIGAGGFGREILCLLHDLFSHHGKDIRGQVVFALHKEYIKEHEIMGVPVYPLETFDFSGYQVLISTGDPKTRAKIAAELPTGVHFGTIIHPQAIVSSWVNIGQGSIICAGCILTCNITLGEHTHLNLQTTIGHDTQIADFFTSAPGAKISGNCKIGNYVYVGTNASIKEKIIITDDVTIGMGAALTRNAEHPGTYVGTPAKLR